MRLFSASVGSWLRLPRSPWTSLKWINYGRVYFTVRLFSLSTLFQLLTTNIGTPGFWMSDKPLVQQELSANLAELLLDIPTADASFDFLRGFWEAIVREWSGLDYIRSVAKA